MNRFTTIAPAEPGARLAALTDQVRQVASELAALTMPSAMPYTANEAQHAMQAIGDEQRLAAFARRYLRARRKRAQMFASDLFADPAWDILLDLYVCSVQGRRVSVSEACLAAGVPGTTALRYLSRLYEAGMVERIPDICDARRSHINLTLSAKESISDWLTKLLTY